jgi:hypothetical protein
MYSFRNASTMILGLAVSTNRRSHAENTRHDSGWRSEQ